MNIERTILHSVAQSLQQFPAVALLGPRQVGKTTLAKSLARQLQDAHKQAVYIDLELPSDLARLTDAELYLREHEGKLVILDEIQRLPDIFTTLRALIDAQRTRGKYAGQFLLLGSASLDLLHQSAESLAGRIAYVELAGLTATEILHAYPQDRSALDRLWLRGGFPDSFLAPDEPASMAWREAFIKTYLERDIPSFGARIPAETMRRFWTMLAHNQGTLLNAARLASGLGVSSPTISRYVDLLADLLLVRTLRPYSGNVGKRLVKSPKTYVRDSGITHALLHIKTREELLAHPVVGTSWEGFVIEQILATIDTVQPYFYRTAAGAEIDLVLERGDTRIAVEIKRTSTPKLSPGFVNGCEDIAATHRFVVYSGQESFPLDAHTRALPLEICLQKLKEIG